MGNERVDDRRSRIIGSLKELIGKLIDDKRMEIEGTREQAGSASVSEPAPAADPVPGKLTELDEPVASDRSDINPGPALGVG